MTDRTLDQIAKETCEWEQTCQIDQHLANTHAILEIQLKEIEQMKIEVDYIPTEETLYRDIRVPYIKLVTLAKSCPFQEVI